MEGIEDSVSLKFDEISESIEIQELDQHLKAVAIERELGREKPLQCCQIYELLIIPQPQTSGYHSFIELQDIFETKKFQLIQELNELVVD